LFQILNIFCSCLPPTTILYQETTAKEEDSKQDKNKPKPVVSIEWNPNSSHHCLIAAVKNCAVIIATGTGGSDDAELIIMHQLQYDLNNVDKIFFIFD
jgi:hypothetical protein